MQNSDVKVVIFTRHAMSDSQWAGLTSEVANACQCEGWNSNLEYAIQRGIAEERINTLEDAEDIIASWMGFKTQTVMAFGVFPPILRAALLGNANPKEGKLILTYEVHNMERAEEGQPPRFEFGGWKLTGRYLIRPNDIARI